MRVALLLACCLAAAPAAAEPMRVPRVGGGGLLEARYEPSPLNRPVPVALLVRDGCAGWTQPRFGAPKGVVPVEFSLPCRRGGADLEGGVLDVLTLVARLRTDAPWWDRRLYLLGSGEGAAVAAAAAGLAPEVSGVILIDGDATPADARADAPVLLLRTDVTGRPGGRPRVYDPARITYRELADPASALAEASAWLARREASRARPQPVERAKQAEPARPPSAPRKTAKADARPRPAKAPKVQLGTARIAPKASPSRLGLREALPAAPGRRPGTGPRAPR